MLHRETPGAGTSFPRSPASCTAPPGRDAWALKQIPQQSNLGSLWYSTHLPCSNGALRSGPWRAAPGEQAGDSGSQIFTYNGNESGTCCQTRLWRFQSEKLRHAKWRLNKEQTLLSKKHDRTDGVSQQIPNPAQVFGSPRGCLTVTPTRSAPALAPTDNNRQQESPARRTLSPLGLAA